MFPIDISLLPSLTTRKALIVVDAQNDFLADDGALPVRMAGDLAQKIAALANDFRRLGGEIIWVQSLFESTRPIDREQIMTSDAAPPSPAAPVPRGRRPRVAAAPISKTKTASTTTTTTTTDPAPDTIPSPEAFLTPAPGKPPGCVRADTTGCEMHPLIRQAVGPKDHVLTKTSYSAFCVEGLLGLLRVRLVTELFICGSLANVGVMATAVDAASHGHVITIVDDCCGSRSMTRSRAALRQMTAMTGCEILSAAGVIDAMRPKLAPSAVAQQRQQQQQGKESGRRGSVSGGKSTPTVRLRIRGERGDAAAPSVSDIQPSLEKLSLSDEAAAADEHEHAPKPIVPKSRRQQQRHQSQSQSQSQTESESQLQQQPNSQSQSPPTARSMAEPCPAQDQSRPDRDPLTTTSTTPPIVNTVTNTTPTAPANGNNLAAESEQPLPTTTIATAGSSGSHDGDDSRRTVDNQDPSKNESTIQSQEADVEKDASPTSVDSEERGKLQQQQSTPPPPIPSAAAAAVTMTAAELPYTSSAKGVESLTVTSSNQAGRSGGSGQAPLTSEQKEDGDEKSESLEETLPMPISNKTAPSEDDIAVETATTTTATPSSPPSPHTSSPGNAEDGTNDNGKMSASTPPPPDNNEDDNSTQHQQSESEPLCEGDTKVIYNVLPPSLLEGIFDRLRSEVSWQRMSHQGGEVPRLVAVQGSISISTDSKPVYRHPSDESPPLHSFTPVVDSIRLATEAAVGHPLNHVLIQLYRGGGDYISEHSDKTLDIARGSSIANVSLGAERVMTLRTKRQQQPQSQQTPANVNTNTNTTNTADSTNANTDPLPTTHQRRTVRARLPHNSLFQMGLQTNQHWLHGIRPDKRLPREKSASELAYEGLRISLTFRRIATFLDIGETRIWGQGARNKTRPSPDGEESGYVVNGQTDEAVAMLRAFGRENQLAGEFDWEEHYGAGFDVLHISVARRLFLAAEDGSDVVAVVVNARLRLLLAALGVSYARGSLSTPQQQKKNFEGVGMVDEVEAKTKAGGGNEVAIKFADNDTARTVVEGQRDVMLYIWKTYGGGKESSSDQEKTADDEDTKQQQQRINDRFQQGLELLDQWISLTEKNAENVASLLAPWETYATSSGDGLIAGSPTPSLADYAFWPVLDNILSSLPSSSSDNASSSPLPLPSLLTYNDRMRATEAVAQTIATAKGVV